MIDDEALRQIEALAHGTRPLVVCDIDEVILHFVMPFSAFLNHNGYQLRTDSYRLTGNVFPSAGGDAIDSVAVHKLLAGFFDAQAAWQQPVEGAMAGIAALERDFDVILLTAMPHAHREHRFSHMRNLGFDQTMLTVESDKGPAVARLARTRPHVAFIDDLAPNHHSVAEHHPEARLHQIMAFNGYSGVMPEPPAHVRRHDDWQAMTAAIRAELA
jgi:hypothetical protein